MLTKSRLKRKKRIRAKINGTKAVPRLTVFKSIKSLYAQVIDDDASVTLVGMSSKSLPAAQVKGKKAGEVAGMLGAEIAKRAVAKKIKKVVFDRSGYRFHGNIKAFADGAREGGLKF